MDIPDLNEILEKADLTHLHQAIQAILELHRKKAQALSMYKPIFKTSLFDLAAIVVTEYDSVAITLMGVGIKPANTDYEKGLIKVDPSRQETLAHDPMRVYKYSARTITNLISRLNELFPKAGYNLENHELYGFGTAQYKTEEEVNREGET